MDHLLNGPAAHQTSGISANNPSPFASYITRAHTVLHKDSVSSIRDFKVTPSLVSDLWINLYQLDHFISQQEAIPFL